MGRAIVRQPQVFLFDEPLSNLDAKLRVQMRSEIKQLHQRLKTTIIYVTHDQIEAMTMADRIVVMRDGYVEQIGSPLELYDRPANLFVAGFIGSPGMNFIPGSISEDDASVFVTKNGVKLPLPGGYSLASGQNLVYGIRPEDLVIREGGVDAEVSLIEPTGAETQITALLGETPVIASIRDRFDIDPGDTISLGINLAKVHLFDAATGQRILR
ncbi:sn-glycerol-3-phosphate import ATP-binding protein UgpC [compost metagenome]